MGARRPFNSGRVPGVEQVGQARLRRPMPSRARRVEAVGDIAASRPRRVLPSERRSADGAVVCL
eukprot:5241695-Pyramimonas_sp.AAC.1